MRVDMRLWFQAFGIADLRAPPRAVQPELDVKAFSPGLQPDLALAVEAAAGGIYLVPNFRVLLLKTGL